jgi:DegV family protein with EDD domain
MTFKKIKLITDSTCDIPADLVKKWDITIVPVFVNIGEESFADDGIQLVREDYYDRLPMMNPLPTTAAPSPGMAGEIIERAFEGADHVVIVTLPSQLSATYEALRLGAANLPADQVTLIDSGTISMAMGYQVLLAAEVAAETGDINQVIATIERVRQHVKLAAQMNSLEYLRRGGRVNFAAAGLGALLQIKPILTVENGEVITLSRVRTTGRAQQELVSMARAQMPFDRLALLHTNNLEGVGWLHEQLADALPDEVLTINVTTTIGTHIGPRCLGFVTLNRNWRQ